MRVCCTGDFHGRGLPEIPDCDLLLVTGDIGLSQRWQVGDAQLMYWLESLHTRGMDIVAIAGNHDYNDEELAQFDWDFLNNESTVACGLTIWGSPLSPTFNNWAHMRPDNELADVWEMIPTDVDIILVHGPPYGCGDYAQRKVHTGSTTLRRKIETDVFPDLKLVVCGHIHEGYGEYTLEYTVWNDDHLRCIPVINASWVNEHYAPGNPPIVVEL